jgi:hypothetical protein
MEKQFGKLKMLPVNKTVVFWSPIEGEDVLVRTGTIAEGSCFFHALLFAYSKEYVSMDIPGRMKFVKRLRASMAGKINHESWEGIGGGLIAKIPFQENVNDILLNFYRFLNEDKVHGKAAKNVIKKLIGEEDEDDLEVYRLIAELIPLEKGFEQKILPNAYSNSQDGKIEDCCKEIISETNTYLKSIEELKSVSNEKVIYIKKVVKKLLTVILKEAENSAYKNYVKGLKNVSEDVDSYTIGLISERFKRDIYFLDGKTRAPYNNSSTADNLKKRKSMIVLWVGKNHYEIVGRLLPGNRIQREFDHNDPLIEKLYNFLVSPEKIVENYPELIPYLPREYRGESTPLSQNNFNDDEDNDSSSDDDSDMMDYKSSDTDQSEYEKYSDIEE